MRWRIPASALNRVVLPVLGLPSKATVAVRTESMISHGKRGDGHARRFAAAQAEAVVAEADFHRIAERSEAEHFNFFAFEKAHFEKALDDGILALDRVDAGFLPGFQLIERGHGWDPKKDSGGGKL